MHSHIYTREAESGRVAFHPSRKALISDLKTCGLKRDLERGKLLHSIAVRSGSDSNVYVAATLLLMYTKCGSMQNAKQVFDQIIHRNVVHWNTLIFGYVDNGDPFHALEVFNHMDCSPDRVTFIAALKACATLPTGNSTQMRACLDKGLSVHVKAQKHRLENDAVVGSNLVRLYSRCGEMEKAHEAFERITKRDAIAWTTLIVGYVENGESITALELFKEMDFAPDIVTFVAAVKAVASLASENNLEKETCLEKGVSVHKQARALGYASDITLANTLVDMYSKCGDMQQACEVFHRMTHRTVVSWNALIFGYVENKLSHLALEVFDRMDCKANHLTFAAVLKACGSLGSLELGQRIHDQVCELGLEQNDVVSTSLVDFYGKCGDMFAAEDVFSRRISQDTVSWTALMGGYSLLGDTFQVFRVVKRMEECGVRLNGVTMQLILVACGRAGRVDDGKVYFESMVGRGIKRTVEHYACMVDMLGKNRRLEEALEFVRRMPVKANSVVWKALLGACYTWSNLEIGKVAFQELVTLNEDKKSVVSACVIMRNIYKRFGLEQPLEMKGYEYVEMEQTTKLKVSANQSYWLADGGNVHFYT